jgi:hypothetical protein
MKIKKQVLSDSLIAWMRYKKNIIKVPGYCTTEIEKAIQAWNEDTLKNVVYDIYLSGYLFTSCSCPFCAKYKDPRHGWTVCKDCEFGKLNGICGYDESLWDEHKLGYQYTTPNNLKKFNSIFEKLKKELQ